jgi:hypothetical protein
MIKDTLKEIINSGPEAAMRLKKCGLTKAEIKPLANAGDLDAQLVLLLGLVAHDYRSQIEEFIDEDTLKMTPVERYELLDTTLFVADPGEIEALSRQIEPLIPAQNDETLKLWWQIFFNDALYPAIPEELARRGDPGAIITMEDYNYSPLEHPQDLADDFNPDDASIKISGNPLDLDRIESLVKDLTKAHGTPGNECGLFVPLQYIFEALGFEWVDNTGNLMGITRQDEAFLTLDLECNPHVDEALVEAFRKTYPKLTIENSSSED